MTRTVKTPATVDALKPLRTKVQVLRRQVPDLADDDVWRPWLAHVTGGTTSTRSMTETQLRAVVDALHGAGAPRKAPAAIGRRRYTDTAQMAMIRGLWLELADLGAVRDRSEAALAAFVKRQTRQDVGWLSPQVAVRVVEALKSWRTRATTRPEDPSL
ncbi:regulatory protein GemA [Azospirillum agricola]|uniref:regulatory protein GemA n=1 Tax=Azospirillum agricola TaxID=1720247 RepID=UPI000A0F1A51|nr:regulatory protein GemA [Azospirillum agricola]SMH62859.1 Protein of unknown function [Azospirillum lipoferum]